MNMESQPFGFWFEDSCNEQCMFLNIITIPDAIIEIVPGRSFGDRKCHLSGDRTYSLRRALPPQLSFIEGNSYAGGKQER